jgi:hypothetical protein
VRQPSSSSFEVQKVPIGSSGGCFGENSLVITKNGETFMRDLKRGDKVKVAGNKESEVVCLVKLTSTNKPMLAVLEGGLYITPNHPILYEGIWKRPCQVTSNF